MDEKNRNLLLAVVLSVVVLFVWQALVIGPQRQAQQQQAQQQQTTQQPGSQTQSQTGTPSPSATGEPSASSAPGAGAPGLPAATASRDAAIAETQRVPIDTPRLRGSINLKGGRIDDLTLKKYRVAVDEDSANVTLLSPSGSPAPNRAFYAQHGWTTAGSAVSAPGPDTEWQVESEGPLSPGNPVTLVYDNGEGVVFRRIIEVDENYMFSVTQQVENNTDEALELFPYGLISRHGIPDTQGFFILHEGPIGVFGEDGLEEFDYDDLLENATPSTYGATGGWLGITDKYWAAVLVPPQDAAYEARLVGDGQGNQARFQTDYLLPAVQVAPGSTGEVTSRLFAGAKESSLIDSYEADFGIQQFELLIDWGWFHFITKPLFIALDFFFNLVGNFGVAILIVTVLIKLVFFPLANKSYVSMSKMKKLQPEMQRLRELYKDDRMRQQQELMELYKREKVNPMSGCLPILIQIPVFFALYKVLFVTIEMRHAPFIGWIQDLSAPDPTSIFNLFGLLPFGVPDFLQIGIWPIIMGISMFIQMRLNPMPGDPIQQKIFTWMPVFFTFILATFPAGLVIYWTWNNILTIAQQWFIMHRQGVEVNLFENMGLDKLFNRLGVGGSSKS
jgi:YidC/Oxa1 family membrane protein insertase